MTRTGVELFVWNRLCRPQLTVQGGVVSDLNIDVDWITVLADADDGSAAEARNLSTCIRGACDLWMMSNFLRTRANTIEELTDAGEGSEIGSLPRIVALPDELQNPANQEIVKRLPGIPSNRFETDIITGLRMRMFCPFRRNRFMGCTGRAQPA